MSIVTKILTEPFLYDHNYWLVGVEYKDNDKIDKTFIYFSTKANAELLKVNDEF